MFSAKTATQYSEMFDGAGIGSTGPNGMHQEAAFPPVTPFHHTQAEIAAGLGRVMARIARGDVPPGNLGFTHSTDIHYQSSRY